MPVVTRIQLSPLIRGNKNRKPQVYRKADFSVLRRDCEGHCFGNKKPRRSEVLNSFNVNEMAITHR